MIATLALTNQALWPTILEPSDELTESKWLTQNSQPHSKLLTDLERYNIVIKQSVSLPRSIEGLHNRDLGDELRKLKVSPQL